MLQPASLQEALWLMSDSWDLNQQHPPQPENSTRPQVRSYFNAMGVREEIDARAKVAGTKRNEGRCCCPDPHSPRSAQALGLPRGRLNWEQPPPELNHSTLASKPPSGVFAYAHLSWFTHAEGTQAHAWSFTQSSPGLSGTVISAMHFSKFHVFSYLYFPTWNNKISSFLIVQLPPCPCQERGENQDFRKLEYFLQCHLPLPLPASIKRSHFSLTFKTTKFIKEIMSFVLSCCTSSKPQSILQVTTFFVVISNTVLCTKVSWQLWGPRHVPSQ